MVAAIYSVLVILYTYAIMKVDDVLLSDAPPWAKLTMVIFCVLLGCFLLVYCAYLQAKAQTKNDEIFKLKRQIISERHKNEQNQDKF